MMELASVMRVPGKAETMLSTAETRGRLTETARDADNSGVFNPGNV